MIITGAVKTEKAIGKIEKENAVILRVAQRASKREIKEEVKRLFGTAVVAVRTYITQKKEKRAIVKFAKGVNAEEEVVNKLKLAV